MKKLILSVAIVAGAAMMACSTADKTAEKASAMTSKIENCTNPDSLKAYVDQANEYVQTLVNSGKIKEAQEFMAKIEPVVKEKAPALAGTFTAVQAAIGKAADTAKETAADAAEQTKEAVSDSIDSKVEAAKDAAADAVDNATDAVKDKASQATDAVKGAAEKVADKTTDVAKNVADKTTDVAKTVADKAGNAAQKTADKLKDLGDK